LDERAARVAEVVHAGRVEDAADRGGRGDGAGGHEGILQNDGMKARGERDNAAIMRPIKKRLMLLISVIGAALMLVVFFKAAAVTRLLFGGGQDEDTTRYILAPLYPFLVGMVIFVALIAVYRWPVGPTEVEAARKGMLDLAFQAALALSLVVAPLWLAAILVAPWLPEPDTSPSRVEPLRQRTLRVFGDQTVRIEKRRGGNVRVYISRVSYEAIPYPDRDDVMRDVAEAWCANVDSWLFPSVVVVDIKTGGRLDSCFCVRAGRARAAPRRPDAQLRGGSLLPVNVVATVDN
jgi:hypothetical protein